MKAKEFTLEDIVEGMESGCGFCIACGSDRADCEPDARKYHCDACGENQVYGAEELIIMGLVH